MKPYLIFFLLAGFLFGESLVLLSTSKTASAVPIILLLLCASNFLIAGLTCHERHGSR